MKYCLQGKKILYIAPIFFSYEKDIRDELLRRGAHVDFLLDRPFDSAFLKAIARIRREWVIGSVDRYYCNNIKLLEGSDYDFIFVVNGQTLSSVTLDRLRAFYPKAKLILYMWDSFGNRRWAVSNLKYFDFKFTFDPVDAKKYGLHFRPLFFSSGFERTPSDILEWDISFIGTAHTDRYSVVSKITRTLDPEIRTFWYLFLQAKWVYWVYRSTSFALRNSKISEFKFDSLGKSFVQDVFNKSKSILDIEHPNQTGLTMRTLETVGAKKKLVTTNSQVKNYDFYNESNICIINRASPVLPEDFLSTPYVDLNVAIYKKYSLQGWMDEILGVVLI